MSADALLSQRVRELWSVLQEGLDAASAQSQGFVLRVLRGVPLPAGMTALPPFDLVGAATTSRYGGVPEISYMGFGIGAAGVTAVPETARSHFLAAVERLQGRARSAHDELAADDVALLGIADGLSACRPTGDARLAALTRWLLQLTDSRSSPAWSGRLRELSADLLDGRGRLRARLAEADIEGILVELSSVQLWPTAYRDVGHPSIEAQQAALKSILTNPSPPSGDIERAAVWVRALDAMLSQTVAGLVPSVGEVGRILRSTQGALRRWVWDAKTRNGQVDAAHWLIDDESHVQAFLWAILSPIFGAHLRDEQYLPGYGLMQPRYDFGIVSLKLIIEVKVVRARQDFKQIEEEIAGDLGLYFSAPERFDRMIAYVYDDCDTAHPELYDALRNALMQRDRRIEDVIVVRRPSMIPNRNQRRQGSP